MTGTVVEKFNFALLILNTSMHVRIYTDGGSRGNPGPSASGAVIKLIEDGKEVKDLERIGKYLGHTTNNQAEYTAIIIGLEKAKEIGAEIVEMRMDSELAVKQLNGQYRVRDQGLAERFLEVFNLRSSFRKITFQHIRREFNKEADAIVNEVLDKELS